MGLVKTLISQIAIDNVASLSKADQTKYYRDFGKNTKPIAIKPGTFIKDLIEFKTQQIRPGRIIQFAYDPITENLPVFDVFPLTLILENNRKSFLGLNFHYLPLKERSLLFKNLAERATNGRILIEHSQLQRSKRGKFRAFGPTLHQYRVNQIRSSIIEIPESLWEAILFLPTERFHLQNKKKTQLQSRKQINNSVSRR